MRKPTTKICKKPDCENTYTVQHGNNRKYCDEHARYSKPFRDYCVKQRTDGKYNDPEDQRNFLTAKRQQEMIRVWANAV